MRIQKKHAFIFAFFLFMLLLTSCDNTVTDSDYVYITQSGSKYHRSDCQYLSKSKIKILRSEVKDNGYTACSVCKP